MCDCGGFGTCQSCLDHQYWQEIEWRREEEELEAYIFEWAFWENIYPEMFLIQEQ